MGRCDFRRSHKYCGSRFLLSLLLSLLLAPPVGRALDDPLGADKAQHWGGCTVLSLGGYGAASLWSPDRGQRFLLGVSFSVFVGLGKELYDGVSGTGTASAWDLAWDGLGALTGGLVALLIDHWLSEVPVQQPGR